MAASALVIATRGGPNPLPGSIGNRFEQMTAMFLQLSFPLVGALIVAHRPRNVVGWLLIFPPAMLLLANLGVIYASQALIVDPGSLPFGALASWTNGWTWVVTLPVLPVLLLVYPTGSPRSPRWRWVAWSAVLMGVVVGIVGAVFTWPHRGRELLVSLEELTPELR
jgi:hypothetical protein